MWGPSSSG
jgi:hypothetical protein